MKKGIAFVLAFVLCLGFSGCGEKDGSAKSVYNALKKVGNLSLEAEYQNIEARHPSGKAPVLEQIVFRMPKEERERNAERSCFIEVYSSEEDMKKVIDYYSNGKLIYGMYSSGNTLLLIDGYVTETAMSKYEKAFQKAVGGEVMCHSTGMQRNNKSSESTFIPPNGIGAREVYNAFKKKN